MLPYLGNNSGGIVGNTCIVLEPVEEVHHIPKMALLRVVVQRDHLTSCEFSGRQLYSQGNIKGNIIN